jgi:hypothetical protein
MEGVRWEWRVAEAYLGRGAVARRCWMRSQASREEVILKLELVYVRYRPICVSPDRTDNQDMGR